MTMEIKNRFARRTGCKTPAIMVVGTMSSSGKSVVAAALCRYFARRGFNPAPFKAQNMSLNSFVTREGGEMGRAQVVQAQAAGIEPHTDMNPILLKPIGEAGCQIILNGRPIGNYPARTYYTMKSRMRTAARAAYDRLAARHDLIILEGAGSPAEINLQAEDFVNMDMAEYAGAAVILVADIDRGGVFAGIYGTVSLLPEKHRRLLAGTIINKFRGDKSLLDPGVQQIERLTGIPVLGVLPYVPNLAIDDEDSLSLDARQPKAGSVLDIAVIRLPRISNFTDFLPLEKTTGVRVRYVRKVHDLGAPDLIILPGTKNTRADLRFLAAGGWCKALKQAAHRLIPVFGICGGYQMLGRRVTDPTGIEGAKGKEAGLDLLCVTTVLEKEKQLAQVSGKTTSDLPFAAAGTPFEGYEIHAGRTTATDPIRRPLVITRRRAKKTRVPEGAISDNGLVFGCYLHGLFDNDRLRTQLLGWLCKRKGIAPTIAPQQKTLVNEFDRLVSLFEKHIAMKRIDCLIER
ncbi:MAG: cobyric acid synthase [Kiritimatiellae bacterium]|nr:cobyric acid synthase [Kiritimatiellia bacterium]